MEAVRPVREGYDLKLLFATLLLLLLGLGIVLDASFARAIQSSSTGGDAYFYFKKQATWAGLALLCLFFWMHVPYGFFRRWWWLGVCAAAALLVLVLIPGIGIEVNGSRRWLGLGGLRFQPSEFAKLALVIALARYAELWRHRVQYFARGFLPAVFVVGLLGALVAKEDLGTAITLVVTGFLMIFMMGARLWHVALLLLVLLGAGVGFLMLEPYRMERVYGWLDLIYRPLEYHDNVNYQPWQGLVALGSGGPTGQGLGRGVAKYMYLPAEHTDYIFATIGEETGLIGTLFLLSLFAYVLIRGLTIAHRTRDWFGSLVAAGMVSLVGVQALLNMAVVTCLVPCTGVPLPFISYGGSSLVFTALALGIVLNISQSPQRAPAGAELRHSREGRPDGWRNRRAHLSGT